MILDLDAIFNDFWIPIFSISSSDFRIPAVSVKRKEISLIIKESSIASLVVPAISETIAYSSFNNVFNKVDLPTFGQPSIVTGIPVFIAFPNSNEFISIFISFLR